MQCQCPGLCEHPALCAVGGEMCRGRSKGCPPTWPPPPMLPAGPPPPALGETASPLANLQPTIGLLVEPTEAALLGGLLGELRAAQLELQQGATPARVTRHRAAWFGAAALIDRYGCADLRLLVLGVP